MTSPDRSASPVATIGPESLAADLLFVARAAVACAAAVTALLAVAGVA
jgi:hypothetical protein